MRKVVVIVCILIPSIVCIGQDTQEIIRELEKTFVEYNVFGSGGYKVKSAKLNYNAPIMDINVVSERTSGSWHYEEVISLHFDVLKTHFKLDYFQNSRCIAASMSGINYKRKYISYDPMKSEPDVFSEDNFLWEEFVFTANSKVVANRILNAFLYLQTIAKENSIQKSNPNILDDAEIKIKNISFVSPDSTSILKANQTGIIKVELVNASSNNAIDIACIVKEEEKSEAFIYDQYTPLYKVSSHSSEIICVPIKASEYVDNGKKYHFNVKVTYKGTTLTGKELTITTNNPQMPSNFRRIAHFAGYF